MRKYIFLCVLAFGALIGRADDYPYPYLAFQTTDGSVSTISTAGLTLAYTDGTLTAAATGATTLTFETAKLALMYFTNTATGIAALTAQGQTQAVKVFAADGRSVGRFGSLQEATTRLAKGTYVVKAQHGQTLKIAIQ